MKKVFLPIILFLLTVSNNLAQELKVPNSKSTSVGQLANAPKPFIAIHKEKDSPFEIYQDLIQDEMVIRMKNQFDVLRFIVRDEAGNDLQVKGKLDKNEVHADLKGLANGRYRLIVDRNNQKIFTEFFLDR